MSKWYEVVIVTTKVFAVEVSDDEGELEAMDYALDDAGRRGDYEVTANPIEGDENIDRCKRHADDVLSAEEA